MPIFEYACGACGQEMSLLILRREEEVGLRCHACGSKRLKRLLSRVAIHRTEAQRLASFDPSRPRDESFYRDGRNVGLWAKKRAQQLGVDLGGRFEETVEKARSGKLPDEIK